MFSKSFTADSSDPETNTPTHTHLALAISTQHTLDTCDSDSVEGIHGFDHVDSALINTGNITTGRGGSSCSNVTTSSETSESGSTRTTDSTSSDPHIDDVTMSSSVSTNRQNLKRDSSNTLHLSEQYVTTNGKTDWNKQCKQQLAAIGFLRKVGLLKQFALTRRCTSSAIINMLLIIL